MGCPGSPPYLPARPHLDQLRRQAKDLLRAAKGADPAARAWLAAVAGELTLASAQLVVAREYGFASWPRLKAEVERRGILNSRDLTRLARLLAEQPEMAVETMERWSDHPRGATPLGYVAMLRYDTVSGVWRDLPGTGASGGGRSAGAETAPHSRRVPQTRVMVRSTSDSG